MIPDRTKLLRRIVHHILHFQELAIRACLGASLALHLFREVNISIEVHALIVKDRSLVGTRQLNAVGEENLLDRLFAGGEVIEEDHLVARFRLGGKGCQFFQRKTLG